MLTTLILTDDSSIFVEYKTDLPKGAIDGIFTIMDIQGLSDAEKTLGLDFKQLPSDVSTFRTFAANNGLALIRVDDDGEDILENYTDYSSSSLEW